MMGNTRRRLCRVYTVYLCSLIVGCGGPSSGPGDASSGDAGTLEAGTHTEGGPGDGGPGDASSGDAGPGDASSGDAATDPGPAPVYAQIHNAPGWSPNTTYAYSSGPPTAPFTRVLNGPGWTASGGTYNPGQPLNAYELTSTGTCTSAATQDPSWGTSLSIHDGTCTWKYISGVDYTSITGWSLDNGNAWASGRTYAFFDIVQTGSPLAAYAQKEAACVSTIRPTNTSGTVSTADGCSWQFLGHINYTSGAVPMPTQTFTTSPITASISGTLLCVTTGPPLALHKWFVSGAGVTAGTKITATGASGCSSGAGYTVNNSQTVASESMFATNEGLSAINIQKPYVAQLWNDREYVSGENGETSPLYLSYHNFRFNDSIATMPPPSSTDTGYGWPITMEAAPGESFMDTYAANADLPLSGYNANHGVGIRGTGTQVVGMNIQDNSYILHGLQIISESSIAVDGATSGRACNYCVADHSILVGGVDSPGIDSWGAFSSFHNDLFIARGTATGAVIFDYGGRLYDSTIVCTGTCTTAIQNTWDWIDPNGVTMSGNAIFGFQHLIATAPISGGLPTRCDDPSHAWACATWQGTHNVTDIAASDGSDFPATTVSGFRNGRWTVFVQDFATGQPYCAHWMGAPGSSSLVPSNCGIVNDVSPSAAFVSWTTGDYRINASSPLFGAGASIGTYNWCNLTPRVHGTWGGCTLNPDTTDLIGTMRPQGTRYDTGAFELVGGG